MLTRLANQLRHPVALCICSFLCFFFLALLLNLPLTPLSIWIEQLARQQQLELQMDDPEVIFPLGLGVEKLEIGSAQIPHPPLLLTELALYPLWTTLASNDPGVSFSLKALQGQIDGIAFRSGKVTAEFSGLQINETLGPQLPLTISGQLDKGEFDGTLPLQGRNKSRMQVSMSRLLLTGLQKFGVSDDILPLGRLHCSIEATGQTLNIIALEISGSALTLLGSGTLRLGPTAARSLVNLELTLTPQAALDPTLKDMLSLLHKPQADGNYQLRLTGTLTNTRIK
ncbi:type II secretion system protein GspN [Malonomonas rubra]|uniref:type II secretion system protein GspN n=1 Tax=Malonomonas rubra TaxID=57040 RepID=UPI0026EA612E|nr:type II secretion system protein GspN [Malonomonas rubra]